MNRRTLFILILVLFPIGIALGGLTFWRLHTIGVQDTQRTANKHYFNDEFYIYGKDEQGKPFLAELMLQRKQTDNGNFTHYYTLELIAKEKYAESKIQEKNSTFEVSPNGFLQKFSKISATDLSTRASYHVIFTLDDTAYQLDTATFDGDFIVRNKPNYTKYASMGRGTIQTANATFPVSLVHLSSYAEDYSQYLYFSGFYQLKSVAHLLVLWDEEGNSYLIDKSIVTSIQENYQSHSWILKKDASGKSKKAFAAAISYDNNEFPRDWKILIPNLDSTRIEVSVDYNNNRATGFASGSITDVNGTRKISGFALITHY